MFGTCLCSMSVRLVESWMQCQFPWQRDLQDCCPSCDFGFGRILSVWFVLFGLFVFVVFQILSKSSRPAAGLHTYPTLLTDWGIPHLPPAASSVYNQGSKTSFLQTFVLSFLCTLSLVPGCSFTGIQVSFRSGVF